MDNHPHLSGKSNTLDEFSAFFRIVNGMFARLVNKSLGRCGQVVMDRLKSPVIQDDRYLLTALTYIDLNPCIARISAHPRHYKWSSYWYYAHGKTDLLITEAPSYIGLAESPEIRQKMYRNIINSLVRAKDPMTIRHAMNSRYLGEPNWMIEKTLNLSKKP